MGTIVAVAFADIFIATVETELLNKSAIKPICWKIYMDDIISLSLWVTKSPGGVLPYIGCIGMCGSKWYGFLALLV